MVCTLQHILEEGIVPTKAKLKIVPKDQGFQIVRLERIIVEMEKEVKELKSTIVEKDRQLKIAEIDGLTGLMRREYFEDEVNKMFSRSKRSNDPFALCVIDLNNLKKVNDVHGHSAGDQMIKGFAGILKRSVRKGDTVARTGGDEYSILLYGQDTNGALIAKLNLLEKIEKGKIHLPFFSGVAVGCASTDLGFKTFGELHHAADIEMYTHKRLIKSK